jgi:hypothetical protein
MRSVYTALIGKPEWKIQVKRSRYRCNNIKMADKEITCEGVDLSGSGTGSGAGSCGYSNEHEMCRIPWAAKKVLVYGKVSYM